MDDRPVNSEASLADNGGVSAAPSRWANGLADWWEREAPAWSEPEAMELLTTLSTHLSLRLGSGLLAEDTLLA